MPKRTRWSTMKKDTISFEKLRQQFAVYNKTAGKSARTVEWYEQKLGLFERYLGPNACLADVTIQNVRGFIADLQERTQRNPNNPHTIMEGPLSSSYINGFVRGLRLLDLAARGRLHRHQHPQAAQAAEDHSQGQGGAERRRGETLGRHLRPRRALRRPWLRDDLGHPRQWSAGLRDLRTPHGIRAPRAGLPEGVGEREQRTARSDRPDLSRRPSEMA